MSIERVVWLDETEINQTLQLRVNLNLNKSSLTMGTPEFYAGDTKIEIETKYIINTSEFIQSAKKSLTETTITTPTPTTIEQEEEEEDNKIIIRSDLIDKNAVDALNTTTLEIDTSKPQSQTINVSDIEDKSKRALSTLTVSEISDEEKIPELIDIEIATSGLESKATDALQTVSNSITESISTEAAKKAQEEARAREAAIVPITINELESKATDALHTVSTSITDSILEEKAKEAEAANKVEIETSGLKSKATDALQAESKHISDSILKEAEAAREREAREREAKERLEAEAANKVEIATSGLESKATAALDTVSKSITESILEEEKAKAARERERLEAEAANKVEIETSGLESKAKDALQAESKHISDSISKAAEKAAKDAKDIPDKMDAEEAAKILEISTSGLESKAKDALSAQSKSIHDTYVKAKAAKEAKKAAKEAAKEAKEREARAAKEKSEQDAAEAARAARAEQEAKEKAEREAERVIPKKEKQIIDITEFTNLPNEKLSDISITVTEPPQPVFILPKDYKIDNLLETFQNMDSMINTAMRLLPNKMRGGDGDGDRHRHSHRDRLDFLARPNPKKVYVPRGQENKSTGKNYARPRSGTGNQIQRRDVNQKQDQKVKQKREPELKNSEWFWKISTDLFRLCKHIIRTPLILRIISVHGSDDIVNQKINGVTNVPDEIIEFQKLLFMKAPVNASSDPKSHHEIFDELFKQLFFSNHEQNTTQEYKYITETKTLYDLIIKNQNYKIRFDQIIFLILKIANAIAIDKTAENYQERFSDGNLVPLVIILYKLTVYVTQTIVGGWINKEVDNNTRLYESLVSKYNDDYLTNHNNSVDIQTVVRIRGGKHGEELNNRFELVQPSDNKDNIESVTNLIIKYSSDPQTYHKKEEKIQKGKGKFQTTIVDVIPQYKDTDFKKYYFGPLTSIFVPIMTNKNLKKSTMFNNLVKKITSGIPVCIIGYGPSGSGKTSSLIYFDAPSDSGLTSEDGLLIMVADEIKNKYNKCTITPYEIVVKDDNNKDVKDAKGAKDVKGGGGAKDVKGAKGKGQRINKNIVEYELKLTQNGSKWVEKESTTTTPLNVSMLKILKDRQTHGTTNNPVSSRSHLIMSVVFEHTDNQSQAKAQIILCDYAGVENKFYCDNPNTIEAFKAIKDPKSKKPVYDAEMKNVHDKLKNDFENGLKEQALNSSDSFNEIFNRIIGSGTQYRFKNFFIIQGQSYYTTIKQRLIDKITDLINKPSTNDGGGDNDSVSKTDGGGNIFEELKDKLNVKIHFDMLTFLELCFTELLGYFWKGGGFDHKFIGPMGDQIPSDIIYDNSKLRLNDMIYNSGIDAENLSTNKSLYDVAIKKIQIKPDMFYENIKTILNEFNTNQYTRLYCDNENRFDPCNIVKSKQKMNNIRETISQLIKSVYDTDDKKIRVPGLTDIDLEINYFLELLQFVHILKTADEKLIEKMARVHIKSIMNKNKFDNNKVTVETDAKIKEICETREHEGEFINQSLSEFRSFLSQLMLSKNQYKYPRFVDSCIPMQCNSRMQSCFGKKDYPLTQLDLHEVKTPETSTILANTITEAKIATNKELSYLVFTVINFSKDANNPPNPPYIDINALQQLNDTLLIQQFEYNTEKEEDHLKQMLIRYVTELNNNNKLLNSLDKTFAGKIITTCIRILDQINNFSSNITQISANLKTLVEEINTSNAATTIGALEFTDTMAKLGINNIACSSNLMPPNSGGSVTRKNYKNMDTRKTRKFFTSLDISEH